VVGVAAAVVATGCGDRGDAREQAGVVRPATTTTTTVAPAVTQTTLDPRPATTTTVAPQPVDDEVVPAEVLSGEAPRLWASPSQAPAGTRVFLEGTGFTPDAWRPHGPLWLSVAPNQGACYLVAETESQISIDDGGHLEGSFLVPERGACRFTAGEEMGTAGLDFHLAYQCTACTFGSFFVQPAAQEHPPTSCGTVAYSHGPVATGEIHAEGVSCDEARTVVADGGTWAPGTGPGHVDVAGFSCDRVSETAQPPLTATYRCVDGSKSVWFVATGRA